LKTASLKDRFRIAHQYIEAMHLTSTEELFHGDAHAGNILVGQDEIAICDYGTSQFSTREKGWARHWRHFAV
jgi:predicted unusual protein kinase regulating ubiquinone biosynthesis (AarF/ABC1/UbiB family)